MVFEQSWKSSAPFGIDSRVRSLGLIKGPRGNGNEKGQGAKAKAGKRQMKALKQMWGSNNCHFTGMIYGGIKRSPNLRF